MTKDEHTAYELWQKLLTSGGNGVGFKEMADALHSAQKTEKEQKVEYGGQVVCTVSASGEVVMTKTGEILQYKNFPKAPKRL